jgi:DNA-directed RNA polymerase subunit RPC12/RpoP
MKYVCPQCFEDFSLLETKQSGPASCPRCGLKNVNENDSCSLEAGPPAWEFRCQDCESRFAVQSPRGPEEVAAMLCPVCRSKKIKWLVLSTAACATGG